MERIKKQIIYSFLFVILIMSMLNLFVFVNHIRITAKYEELSFSLLQKNKLLLSVDEMIQTYNSLTKNIDDPALLARYADEKRSINGTLKNIEGSLKFIESKAIMRGIRNTVYSILADCDSGIIGAEEGNLVASSSYYESASKKYFFVKENMSNLIISEFKYFEDLHTTVIATTKQMYMVFIVSLVLITLFFMTYAVLFATNLIEPLIRLIDTVEKVSSGDIKVKLGKDLVMRGDGIGRLAQSFQVMLDKIRENIQELTIKNDEVMLTKQELESRVIELEKVQRIMVDREIKMIDLKRKIAELESKVKR
ncbi:MAG: HAMP domain-containing protein [Candidatus Woesearchaeota archaeon]|nr:HAMP domain-containing protein [Candidatus Woesearchaeota archaeon]